MSIQCFSPDCQNPVIAQCRCGKFFCQEHSKLELCATCGTQLEKELVQKKYADLADSVGDQLRAGNFLGLGSFSPTWWLRITMRGKERKIVARIEEANPGFSSFYKAWKANKNAQARFIIGQAAVDGVLDYMSDDVRTRRVVSKELRKQGK